MWRDIAIMLAAQIAPDRAAADRALQDAIERYQDSAPFQIAQAQALRKQPEQALHWLQRARELRDPGVQGLRYDPFLLQYRDDPRFADFFREESGR